MRHLTLPSYQWVTSETRRMLDQFHGSYDLPPATTDTPVRVPAMLCAMVSRLAGSDAGFLYIESPDNTSTCVDLMILAPTPEGQAPLTVHDLRQHLAARLHRVPSLRRRLAMIPGGIDTPRWVDDDLFDLGYHVRSASLDTPGDEAALQEYVATCLPGLIDLRHPLWQVILVSGLADRRQALVWRFHHTLADGAGLITTLSRLLGPPSPNDHPPTNWTPSPPASPWRLTASGLRQQARAWRGTIGLASETRRRFKEVDQRRASSKVAVPRSMGDAPRTVLNRSADAQRVFGLAQVDLASLQAVRRAAGTTLSDVVLTVVAGGLRTHLIANGDLPNEPLVVNVPVANDEPGARPRTTGNVFANYFSYLATNESDPRARLMMVAAANAEAKAQLEIQGRHTLPAWLDRIPPLVASRASSFLTRRLADGRAAPDFNVLVSNVRVTEPNWSIGGRAVERFAMSGPVAPGAGLNITVTGYGDRLHLALVANPAAVADVGALASRLEAAAEELRDTWVGS